MVRPIADFERRLAALAVADEKRQQFAEDFLVEFAEWLQAAQQFNIDQ